MFEDREKWHFYILGTKESSRGINEDPPRREFWAIQCDFILKMLKKTEMSKPLLLAKSLSFPPS